MFLETFLDAKFCPKHFERKRHFMQVANMIQMFLEGEGASDTFVFNETVNMVTSGGRVVSFWSEDVKCFTFEQ